MMMTGVKVHQ
jgi:hypothetical protein